MAWKRGQQYWSWAHAGDGERRQTPLGTTSRALATEIERMLDILRSRRAWRLLRAVVVEGTLTLGVLFDAFREGDHALARLGAELDDVDLNQYVEEWQRWARKRASAHGVEKYAKQLRALIPEGVFPRSRFTRKVLARTLAGLPGSGSTGRRYHSAWSSFARYLVEVEVLDHNPLRDVSPPRENAPRASFLELEDVWRLVDAQPEPYRTLAALREGAGVEISAALRVRRRDVQGGLVQVRGTKNEWRTRPVYVESWARPYLEARIRELHPDALLFEGVTARAAFDVHRAALRALGFPQGYTMHDARHSFAVRWMRAGIDPNVIASNLGHKDASLVLRVYGKHRPRAVDLAKVGDSFGDSTLVVKRRKRA